MIDPLLLIDQDLQDLLDLLFISHRPFTSASIDKTEANEGWTGTADGPVRMVKMTEGSVGVSVRMMTERVMTDDLRVMMMMMWMRSVVRGRVGMGLEEETAQVLDLMKRRPKFGNLRLTPEPFEVSLDACDPSDQLFLLRTVPSHHHELLLLLMIMMMMMIGGLRDAGEGSGG